MPRPRVLDWLPQSMAQSSRRHARGGTNLTSHQLHLTAHGCPAGGTQQSGPMIISPNYLLLTRSHADGVITRQARVRRKQRAAARSLAVAVPPRDPSDGPVPPAGSPCSTPCVVGRYEQSVRSTVVEAADQPTSSLVSRHRLKPLPSPRCAARASPVRRHHRARTVRVDHRRSKPGHVPHTLCIRHIRLLEPSAAAALPFGRAPSTRALLGPGCKET